MKTKNFLLDTQFLYQLDQQKIKTQYIKIILLTFDEREIREIQGTIQSGSLSVNSTAAIRRTINLSMFANVQNNDLTNLDNLISLNKKVKIFVGYYNDINQQDYDEIVWFPCGIFVISSANLSQSTNGMSISIQGKDKMSLLDGTAGGVFPAQTNLGEIEAVDEYGNIYYEHPTIYMIIQEMVCHIGGEHINNIFINGLDKQVKQLLKYNGDIPIWFTTNYSNFKIQYEKPAETGWIKFERGDDIGYEMTDFTYPGELIAAAGTTVQQMLDKIAKTLGNFEFFYDIEGRFHFQEIQNYQNTRYSELDQSAVEQECALQHLQLNDYIRTFSNTKYFTTFENGSTQTGFNYNPKYDNIKNDFIVWGSRTSSSGAVRPIMYHLAIDKKPKLYYAQLNLFEKIDENTQKKVYTAHSGAAAANEILIGVPCTEWREELYRRALIRSNSSADDDYAYYDAELLSFWREIYFYNEDSSQMEWCYEIQENHPEGLNYWLDFLDTGASLVGKYSVQSIGRRSKVINNDKIRSVYNKEVPPVIFVENKGEQIALLTEISEYERTGLIVLLYTEDQRNYFYVSSTGMSCFEQIQELIYQNLTYNAQAQITCHPRYYLEPNQVVKVYNKDTHVDGEFIISQFSLPLNYNGTMSITVNENLTKM